MEFADVVARRKMVRRYTDEPVDPAAVDQVVAAALRTPSAGFTQAVSYLVLTGVDVERYWSVTVDPDREPDRWLRGLRTAPVLILVWTDQDAYLDRYALPDKGWTDRDPGRWSAPYWWVDAGMGVMAALHSAVDLGLGACFFGVPTTRVDAVRAAFEVPDGQASVGVVSLGHAEESPAPQQAQNRRRQRRPPEQLVHRGRWR